MIYLVKFFLGHTVFYRYLQMHLMRIKLPFALLKASYRVLLGLKYIENLFFRNFYQKTGVDFAFANCTYSRVPNNRPSPLIIFSKIFQPPLLFQPPPPFINFWKNEMVVHKISE